MPKTYKTDQQIINALKYGGHRRRDAMAYLFRNSGIKEKVTNFIIHRTGRVEDVSDVMIESFIIFERNLRYNKFKGESSLTTYYYSIAKMYWLNKAKKQNLKIVKESSEMFNLKDIQNPELIFIDNESKKNLDKILSLLTEKCKGVLKYWSQDYTFSEIAKKLNLGSEGSVRKQKFYCLKKLAMHIKEHPELIPAYYQGVYD